MQQVIAVIRLHPARYPYPHVPSSSNVMKEAPNKCFIEEYLLFLKATLHQSCLNEVRDSPSFAQKQGTWQPAFIFSAHPGVSVRLGSSTKVFIILYLSYKYLRQCFPTFSQSWYSEKMMVFIIYCNKGIRRSASMTKELGEEMEVGQGTRGSHPMHRGGRDQCVHTLRTQHRFCQGDAALKWVFSSAPLGNKRDFRVLMVRDWDSILFIIRQYSHIADYILSTA